MATEDPVSDERLSAGQRAFLHATRRAVLVTIAPDGRPRPVPICFAVSPDGPVLYTTIDAKPKRQTGTAPLARVRDIAADDRVSVLADRWDEDWTRLAWLRVEGRARLLEAGDMDDAVAAERDQAVRALRAKYEQYADHRLEDRPLIRVEIDRTVQWGDVGLETVYGG